MGFKLIAENEKGEQLQLTNNSAYDVLKIEGLNPPNANINTSAISGLDGEIFNSSKVNLRNLVLTLNIKNPVEENRQILYKYFRVKRKCKLYFKNQNRDVFIEGYVETFENDLFGMTQQPQISIICPQPFFKAIDDIIVEFSNTIPLFEFPFSIGHEGIEFSRINILTTRYINAGDVETGMIIKMTARTDQILNPIIYNLTTQEFFGLNIDLSAGDIVTINTCVGEKSVILNHNNVVTNILGKRTTGSKWLQLIPGTNEISYSADEGTKNLNVVISTVQQYEGV